jgi:WD40 repeat protein
MPKQTWSSTKATTIQFGIAITRHWAITLPLPATIALLDCGVPIAFSRCAFMRATYPMSMYVKSECATKAPLRQDRNSSTTRYLLQCVKFHPNCNYIATGSTDKCIRLWETQSGDVRHVVASPTTLSLTDCFAYNSKLTTDAPVATYSVCES